MEHLLRLPPDITAVFAMSDIMALGAIRALQDHGLRVPQDISVTGYDGIALGQYSVPRLTTIRQNKEQLAPPQRQNSAAQKSRNPAPPCMRWFLLNSSRERA